MAAVTHRQSSFDWIRLIQKPQAPKRWKILLETLAGQRRQAVGNADCMTIPTGWWLENRQIGNQRRRICAVVAQQESWSVSHE